MIVEMSCFLNRNYPACAVKVIKICPITNEIVEYPSLRHVSKQNIIIRH